MPHSVQGLEKKAEQSILQLESPYFHYLSELLSVWTNSLATMSALDINFRISQSEIGKNLKAFFREIVAKKIVFTKYCSPETVDRVKQFMERTLPEYSYSLEEASVQPEFEKNLPWGFETKDILRELVEMLYDTAQPTRRASSKPRARRTSLLLQNPEKILGDSADQMVWNVSEQFNKLASVLKDSEVAKEVSLSITTEHQTGEACSRLRPPELR